MPSVVVDSPDTGTPTLSLKATKSSVGATEFVKLTVSISQAVSKDVWVFVSVNDPDKWVINADNVHDDVLALNSGGTAKQAAMPISLGNTKYGSVTIGSAEADDDTYSGYQAQIFNEGKSGVKNPGDANQKGFWVRIAAGQTSQEVDVKPAYDTTNTQSRTETFRISDYGIVYGVSGLLYKDGNSLNSSNVLLNRQSHGSSVNVTITPQSYTERNNNSVFDNIAGQTTNQSIWRIGIDPDKSHTITVQTEGTVPNNFTLTIKVQQLDGSWVSHKLTSYQVQDNGDVRIYTISGSLLKGTEGQIQIGPFSPYSCVGDYVFTIDGSGSQPGGANGNVVPLSPLSPISNDALSGFTPDSNSSGGTGIPDSFTSGPGGDTETNANGDVIFQSIINADGTTDVWSYDVNVQPFVASERVYDASGNVISTTLYNAQDDVVLSGVGALNDDGTTTVVLYNADNQVGGQEIDQKQAYFGVGGGTSLTMYQTASQLDPQVVSIYDDEGGLVSATFYDASGTLSETESVSSIWYEGLTFYKFYNPANVLVEEIVSGYTVEPYVSTDTTYDPATGDALTVRQYSNSGAIYQTGIYTYDDGVTTLTLDNANGALSEVDVNNSDGSKTVSLYIVSGEPYASGVEDFNASGQLTSATFYYADDVIYQTKTMNLDDDATTILTYNTSGQLVTKEVDNGTRDVTTYGIVGQAYSGEAILYAYDDDIISETFFDNNGDAEVKTFFIPYERMTSTTDTIYNSSDDLIQQTTYDLSGDITQVETVAYNLNGSSTALFYNASGALTEQEVVYADDWTDITLYSSPGQLTPSTESLYDSDDALQEQTITNANGSKAVSQYNIENQSYVTEISNYNAAGQLTSQEFLDLNNNIVATSTTTANSDGSTTTDIFNSLGFITSQEIVYAATNLTTVVDYNANGSVDDVVDTQINADRSTTVSKYNGQGILTQLTTTMADGSSVVVSYTLETDDDATGYAKSVGDYNSSGTLTSATFYNLNGSLSGTETVAVNGDDDIVVTNLNALGAVTSLQIQDPDGSGSLAVYGIAGADDDFNSTLTIYGAGGAETSETFFNNDGTKDVFTYLINSPYAESDAHYSASGALLTEDMIDANGDDVLFGTASANADGSITINFVDANGVLQMSQTDNLDGSHVSTTYNIASEPYTSMTSAYNAGDDLVSVSYFGDDGSLYGNVDYTTDANDDVIAKTYNVTGTLIEDFVENPDGSSSDTKYSASGSVLATVLVNVVNADDDVTTTATDTTYNATGGLSEVKTTVNVIDTDDDVAYTSTTDSIYNASGALVEQKTVSPDGSSDDALYNLTSGPYVTTDSQYNADGVLASETGIYADGSTDVFTFGISGRDYAETEVHYDSSGQPVEKTLLDANDGVLLSGTVVAGANGEYSVTYLNADDTVVQTETDYSGGTISETVYGVTGQPYQYETSFYNSDGQKTRETLYYTSGIVYQYQYISYSVDGVSTTIYDANFGILDNIQQNYDGSSEITTYGGGSISLESEYNPSGLLTQTVQTNNDSSQTVTTYLIANEPYTELIANFSTAGQLTSETLLNADGSVNETAAVTYDDFTNAQTITFSDPSGNVERVRTTATNGDYEIHTFNVTGESYASSNTKYNADDDIVSQTFYASSGALNRSERYAYNSSNDLIGEATYNADDDIVQLVQYSSTTTTTYDYDATGAVTSQTNLNLDGSMTVQLFGIVGKSYATEIDDYAASGALTGQTFYNTDGTRDVWDYAFTGMPFTQSDAIYAANDDELSQTLYSAPGVVYQTTTYTYGPGGRSTIPLQRRMASLPRTISPIPMAPRSIPYSTTSAFLTRRASRISTPTEMRSVRSTTPQTEPSIKPKPTHTMLGVTKRRPSLTPMAISSVSNRTLRPARPSPTTTPMV